MKRAIFAAAAILCAAGCDPVHGVTGVARSAPTGCGPGGDVYASAGPIAGATVRIACPGEGRNEELATTDARGRFQYRNVGLWSNDCDIVVDKPGFAPARFRIGDSCALPTGDSSCHFVSVFAELAPTGPAGAPAAARAP